jgi:hypothetical protein
MWNAACGMRNFRKRRLIFDILDKVKIPISVFDSPGLRMGKIRAQQELRPAARRK